MMTERRKVTFKLYPNAAQKERLEAWTRLHCELYNGALQERIEAYRKAGKSINWYDQKKYVPLLRYDRPEFVPLGSHALEQTLKRLDLAFQAFFRRVKAGQTPGFPRFKSAKRFSGFSYPDKAGWNVLQHGKRGAMIRVGSGTDTMMIRARGSHRFDPTAFTWNDLTLTRNTQDEWSASVTIRVSIEGCKRERVGSEQHGMDLGTTDWATFEDGTTIENPRWVRDGLPTLAELQRARAKKRRGSIRYRRISKDIARFHDHVANMRRDFIHKETTKLVQRSAVIATEELSPSNMSRTARGTVEQPGRNVKQKSGLNRENLSAGYGMTHEMLAYKAVEAGTRLHICNTRQLKPSQRCAKCWAITPKTLSQREHVCAHCGHTIQRDQNSASVMLIDAHTPGTGVAARPKPLPRKRGKPKSTTREAPENLKRQSMKCLVPSMGSERAH